MAHVKSIGKSVRFLERLVGRLTIIAFIVFITVILTSTKANAQNQERTIEYNPTTELYQVTDVDGNYYHVDFKGEINGPFKYSYGNVTICGNMLDGKRHGMFKTTEVTDNGSKTIVVFYNNGNVIRVKETAVYAVN